MKLVVERFEPASILGFNCDRFARVGSVQGDENVVVLVVLEELDCVGQELGHEYNLT